MAIIPIVVNSKSNTQHDNLIYGRHYLTVYIDNYTNRPHSRTFIIICKIRNFTANIWLFNRNIKHTYYKIEFTKFSQSFRFPFS